MWEMREVERSAANQGEGSSESGGGGNVGHAGRCARCWLSMCDMVCWHESGSDIALDAPTSARSFPMIPQ